MGRTAYRATLPGRDRGAGGNGGPEIRYVASCRARRAVDDGAGYSVDMANVIHLVCATVRPDAPPDVIEAALDRARAHIAVLPSRREGLPLSLLEAAACGRPIVATDVPGCREIARHNVNAFLVPVDDPPPLAGALTVLARDAALRRRLGAAGRRIVENEFSAERIGDATVDLYDRLLKMDAGLLPPPGMPG